MKANRLERLVVLVAVLGGVSSARAAPLGTGFTYQGQLKENGVPANGLYDLRFRLYDAVAGGAQVGATLCANDVSVTNGLFSVPLDFGNEFNGDQRFLEVELRVDTGLDCANPAGFVILAPRQALSATPYALGLRLPLSQTVTTGSDAINVTNAGTGDCAQFNITDPSNVGEAVEGRTAGGGDAIQGINTGTGRAGLFQINNAANSAPAIYATTNGTGPGLRVQRGNQYLEIDKTSINSEGTGLLGDPLYLNNDTTNSVLIGLGGGRVGIGAVFPGRKLQIGDATTPNSEGMIRLASRSGTQGSNRVWDIGVPETDADSSGFGYSFVIDDTGLGTDPEFMVKYGSGNVGIGMVTPAAKLHVDGGTDTAPAGGGYLVLGATNSTNISIDNNEIMARNNGAAATLALNASGGNVTLIQSGAGGVAIGTTTIPTGVLLAVDGKVLCEELEVQLSGDWPDYVFADDYALLPLSELEQSVEQNGHLPGIPSAAQVAERGINVGQMQTLTLQKVEELTLYMIDMHKQLGALERENQTLRERLSALEGGR